MYVEAYNDGYEKEYTGFTHPNVVGYYMLLGDSAFQQKFDLYSEDDNYSYLHDPQVREIETRENEIHVKYNIISVEGYYDDYFYYETETNQTEMQLFALSDDDGISWFFMEENDYFNDEILKANNRLIK